MCGVYMGKSTDKGMKECKERSKVKPASCEKCSKVFEFKETYYTQTSKNITYRKKYCIACHDKLYI